MQLEQRYPLAVLIDLIVEVWGCHNSFSTSLARI